MNKHKVHLEPQTAILQLHRSPGRWQEVLESRYVWEAAATQLPGELVGRDLGREVMFGQVLRDNPGTLLQKSCV